MGILDDRIIFSQLECRDNYEQVKEEVRKLDYRLPQFQCINFPAWERAWDNARTTYTKCIVVLAHEWAHHLDIVTFKSGGFDKVPYEEMFRFDYPFPFTCLMAQKMRKLVKDTWRYGKQFMKRVNAGNPICHFYDPDKSWGFTCNEYVSGTDHDCDCDGLKKKCKYIKPGQEVD